MNTYYNPSFKSIFYKNINIYYLVEDKTPMKNKNVAPQLICKILECITRFAKLECLIFATYFYFLYFKTITKYNYKLFPKNGKLIF
jgi:hypothetical protein